MHRVQEDREMQPQVARGARGGELETVAREHEV